MTTFFCTSCGACFTRPQRAAEGRGECFGFASSEIVCCCPRCGGGFITLTNEGRYAL